MTTHDIDVRRDSSALLIVDIQADFLPGGALAVTEGDRILPLVAAGMESGLFGTLVATQDWHPSNHISFAGRHEGKQPMESIELYGHQQTLWPEHCVQGTPGAELHSGLPWVRLSAVIRKGADADVDSYSGFRNNWGPGGSRPKTGLAGYLRDRGVENVYVCGLARDVCVRWTVEDAVAEGFNTTMLWDMSRSVNPSGDDRLHTELTARGVRIVSSAALGLG